MTKKYDKIRREKAKKLALIKGKEIVEEEPPKKYTKSAGIAAKKISDKYKKIRKKINIDIVEEIKDVASKKSAQIAAKKISNKYIKMRYKKSPPTFLVDEADVEAIDYNNDSDEDMFAKESIVIAANKIFDTYKKGQAENNLDEAETINYVDDTNLDDVRESKNAKIDAKKITEKYKRLARKRKIKPTPTAVVTDGFRDPSKKRKSTTKSVIITARNISKKCKNLRYR